MEYFEFGDLEAYLDTSRTEWDARVISSQLIDGIKVLHDQRWIHQDLKPQNVFVVKPGPHWWVKIGDFGISKKITEGRTGVSFASGTIDYMAPETYDIGEKGLEHPLAVDMWSLGCILFNILTQRTPIPRTKLYAYSHGNMEFPSHLLLSKNVSQEGIDFIKKLMSPNPVDRPTAAEASVSVWVNGLRNEAQAALSKAGFDVQSRKFDAQAALLWAIENGSKDAVFMVLDEEVNIEGTAVEGGWTAMHKAVRLGKLEAVKWLVDDGADVNVVAGTYKDTPLHLAVYYGHSDIAQYLIENGADIEATNCYSGTPLGRFQNDDSVSCMQILLTKGANTECFDSDSEGPLHLAARYGFLGVTKQLLAHGANVNAKNKDGFTPLELAKGTDVQHKDIIQALLAQGSKTESLKHRGLRGLVSGLEKLGNSISHYARFCDNCKKSSMKLDTFWHCNICSEDNYDLCPNCYEKGFKCPGLHDLKQMKWTGDEWGYDQDDVMQIKDGSECPVDPDLYFTDVPSPGKPTQESSTDDTQAASDSKTEVPSSETQAETAPIAAASTLDLSSQRIGSKPDDRPPLPPRSSVASSSTSRPTLSAGEFWF